MVKVAAGGIRDVSENHAEVYSRMHDIDLVEIVGKNGTIKKDIDCKIMLYCYKNDFKG